MREYLTQEDILRRAQEILDIPLGKIDKTGRLGTGKGAIGTVIEESVFGYAPNSNAEPDFPEAGVELKTTPYVRNKNHLVRAKERLVCNLIDYMVEYTVTRFEESSFWHKCATMLLMSYEHHSDLPKKDFKIDRAVLFSFPNADLEIIKKDWRIILEKILDGKAHLLTEGDTFYLAACTKGASAKSMRAQPFNTIKAKQRAYSLKASYMTQILRSYIFGSKDDEHIVKDWRRLSVGGLSGYVESKVSAYYGKTQHELVRMLGIKNADRLKHLNAVILGRMLDVKGKLSETNEFKNANVIPKTIRLESNGKVKEHMSFPVFEFCELVRETWEESSLRKYLEPTKFLFVVFRKNESKQDYVFERVFFWNIPFEDLEEVRRVWERTVRVIRTGVIIAEKNGRKYNNLPKATESPIAHVRPHGKDSNDTSMLPDGRALTKQSFWLNNRYIENVVRKQGTSASRHRDASGASNASTGGVLLPLYSLRAACGSLRGPGQHPEEIRQLVCESGVRKLSSEKHFIVTAIGDSMERKIKEGDLCVFEWSHPAVSDLALVERTDAFSETGGCYAIKRYDGGIRLSSLNRKYVPIEMDENCRLIAVFRGVLRREAGADVYHVK